MAQTIALQNHFVQFVPLDGTFFFSLGPDARLGAGAVTATAQHDGVATTVPILLKSFKWQPDLRTRVVGNADLWTSL